MSLPTSAMLDVVLCIEVIHNLQCDSDVQCLLTRTNTHVHATHAYTHMHTDTFMHIHTCTHTHIYTYIHTYTNTQTHTHTHIHTQIWDKETLKLLKILTGHQKPVLCLQFTGDILVSGAQDSSVKLVQPISLLCFVPVKPCLHA